MSDKLPAEPTSRERQAQLEFEFKRIIVGNTYEQSIENFKRYTDTIAKAATDAALEKAAAWCEQQVGDFAQYFNGPSAAKAVRAMKGKADGK